VRGPVTNLSAERSAPVPSPYAADRILHFLVEPDGHLIGARDLVG